MSEPQQRDDDDISIAVEVRSGWSEQRRHDEDGKSITEELRAALPVRRRDEDGESIASELRAVLPVRRRIWLPYYGDEAGIINLKEVASHQEWVLVFGLKQ